MPVKDSCQFVNVLLPDPLVVRLKIGFSWSKQSNNPRQKMRVLDIVLDLTCAHPYRLENDKKQVRISRERVIRSLRQSSQNWQAKGQISLPSRDIIKWYYRCHACFLPFLSTNGFFGSQWHPFQSVERGSPLVNGIMTWEEDRHGVWHYEMSRASFSFYLF